VLDRGRGRVEEAAYRECLLGVAVAGLEEPEITLGAGRK
jgi:hypothetical protein